MKERPILFSASMVRAILEGRKTVMRRVVKPQPPTPEQVHALAGIDYSWIAPTHPRIEYHRPAGPVWAVRDLMGREPNLRCPYGQPGDRLWVRETFAQWPTCDLVRGGKVGMTAYRAGKPVLVPPLGAHVPLDQWPREWRDDTKPESVCWRPSIHMPRWASRLTLEVTGVRVERLQDISTEQAVAEGMHTFPHKGGTAYAWSADDKHGHGSATGAMRWIWDQINGEGAWHANPWVWVVEFKRIQQAYAEAITA